MGFEPRCNLTTIIICKDKIEDKIVADIREMLLKKADVLEIPSGLYVHQHYILDGCEYETNDTLAEISTKYPFLLIAIECEYIDQGSGISMIKSYDQMILKNGVSRNDLDVKIYEDGHAKVKKYIVKTFYEPVKYYYDVKKKKKFPYDRNGLIKNKLNLDKI